jgi:iron complex transport system substrate-binding protein
MKRLFTILFALLVCAALGLSACATATQTAAPTTEAPPAATPTPEAVSLTDGLDRTITLESQPMRIVSLAPSNTEILYAIGAGPQVVGRDDFSDYPVEAASVQSVGGNMGAYDNEAIVALNPDLVLAAEINTPEQVQALEDLGLAVFYLKNPTDLDGLFANLLMVGQMTGHTAEAEALVSSLKERVMAVDAKVSTVENKPIVFYELDATDPNAPYTSGPGTFVDLLIARAGAQNLGNALESAWAQISLEDLVVQNPQIILLGDAVWGGVTLETVAARAGWDQLDAVKNSQVFPFDDNLVSRPGPRLVDGIEQLAKLLHPELFQ